MQVVFGGTCRVDLVGKDKALENIAGAARRRRSDVDAPLLAVASVNLDHLHHFGRHGGWRDAALLDTDRVRWFSLLDGAPVVQRARRVTSFPWPRLAGSDLLAPLLEKAADSGHRVGFLGGTDETLGILRERLSTDLPGLHIAGTWAPARAEILSPSRSDDVAQAVADAGVDILVVGLGKPRQEVWIQEHGWDTGASVLLAFGASADFLAGRAQRATPWIQKHNLEWAYRLAHEPRRLWRRYLLEGPPAVYDLWSAASVVSQQG